MEFYNNLQLDPFVLKQKIKKTQSLTKRRILFLTIIIRSLLIVGFAIAFISTIGKIFGTENNFLAVVLFCMLLSLRFVHFGYKISHSILSLAIILLILFLIPIISQLDNIFLKTILNFVFIITIFFLTGNNPKMGNPGLYSFSYIFLSGTSIPLNHQQLLSRAILLSLSAIIFSMIFIYKHHEKNLQETFVSSLVKGGFFSKKNLWLIYYALGVSFILCLGYLINLQRFMWVGIAFSSLISVYEIKDIKGRFYDRILGVVVGSILFFILVQFIPPNILGIVGGIALGLCATYRFKNIYNCFGALAVAVSLFKIPEALSLRVINNLFGLILGLVYLYVGQMLFRKRDSNSFNRV